jgi:hypothetical protein
MKPTKQMFGQQYLWHTEINIQQHKEKHETYKTFISKGIQNENRLTVNIMMKCIYLCRTEDSFNLYNPVLYSISCSLMCLYFERIVINAHRNLWRFCSLFILKSGFLFSANNIVILKLKMYSHLSSVTYTCICICLFSNDQKLSPITFTMILTVSRFSFCIPLLMNVLYVSCFSLCCCMFISVCQRYCCPNIWQDNLPVLS